MLLSLFKFSQDFLLFPNLLELNERYGPQFTSCLNLESLSSHKLQLDLDCSFSSKIQFYFFSLLLVALECYMLGHNTHFADNLVIFDYLVNLEF